MAMRCVWTCLATEGDCRCTQLTSGHRGGDGSSVRIGISWGGCLDPRREKGGRRSEGGKGKEEKGGRRREGGKAREEKEGGRREGEGREHTGGGRQEGGGKGKREE
eukprot:361337-Chlamydomonas_euryale.AAC.2